MNLGIKECRVPFLGHCDLDLVFRIIISGADLILFEVGIPSLDGDMLWTFFLCHCDLDL